MSGGPEIDDVDDAMNVANETAANRPVVARIVKGFVVPDGARRVRVTDEKSKCCWRSLDEVLNSDVLDLTPQGQPQWMFGAVGRPKQHRTISEVADPVSELVGNLMVIKQANLRSDSVTLAAESTPESPEVLNQVILAIAEEAASLRFERQEAERKGVDTSVFSMRRVQALKAIGDTWIKRKEQIQQQSVDMDSPAFSELFRFISETFAKAMEAAGVRQELSDTVFAQFSKLLNEDDWKTEAKSRMTK
jgi:hypothetical protein